MRESGKASISSVTGRILLSPAGIALKKVCVPFQRWYQIFTNRLKMLSKQQSPGCCKALIQVPNWKVTFEQTTSNFPRSEKNQDRKEITRGWNRAEFLTVWMRSAVSQGQTLNYLCVLFSTSPKPSEKGVATLWLAEGGGMPQAALNH